MKKILTNKVVYCEKCKKFIEYTKDEIEKREDVYYVYGCEPNYYDIKYITCPKCNKTIDI